MIFSISFFFKHLVSESQVIKLNVAIFSIFFGIDNNNSVHNFIVLGSKLVKDEDGVKMDKTYYKQIVSSIMYFTVTRSEMMFVVSLSYMQNKSVEIFKGNN